MIYTVTFNPSLDYVVDVKNFKTGQLNRCLLYTSYHGRNFLKLRI